MSASPLRIRQADISDLEAILVLDRATENAPHWSMSVYAHLLESVHSDANRRSLFLTELDSAFAPGMIERELGGFVVVSYVPGSPLGLGGGCELESLAVSTACRRLGIGRRLCDTAIEWCRGQGACSVELEVRAGSVPALALYRSLGFVQTGWRPKYYTHPEDDALLLRLNLAEAD